MYNKMKPGPLCPSNPYLYFKEFAAFNNKASCQMEEIRDKIYIEVKRNDINDLI